MEWNDRFLIRTANGPRSASQITSAPSRASTVEPRATRREAMGKLGTTPVAAMLPAGAVDLIRTRLYHPPSGTR